MFIFIPLSIIFLAFAYLQLNVDVSLFEKMIVYAIVIVTSLVSFKLYKNIKRNMKQLELNKILMQIKTLNSKLSQDKDEKTQMILKQQIQKLKDEYETLS